MNIHVGTSGWSYNHWRSVFYPDRLPAGKRLAYYVRQFETTEVNNSYYRWPSDETVIAWQRALPPGFLMSVKAPRGLTHYARLTHPENWISQITHSLSLLKDNLGVLLVQLSANFAADPERMAAFLEQVPSWIRTTVELRHPTWYTEETFRLLEKHKTAYCIMSGAKLPTVLRATAPFVYIRMHGPDNERLYSGSYPDDTLTWWAGRIRAWAESGLEVFIYFNNDGQAWAVNNALTLQHMLGLAPPENQTRLAFD